MSGVPGDLEQLGRQIRAQVYRSTGIPVGVGIAGTKTLSKLANQAAKKWQAQSGGVVDLRDQVKRDWVLKKCPASDVWGVGRKMTAHLEGMGIKSAWELSKADPWMLRKRFSVVIEKTARELAGTTLPGTGRAGPPQAGDLLQPDVWQAPDGCGGHQGGGGDLHGARHRKVGGQQSLCKKLRVSIRTGFFNPDEAKYANGVVVELPYPTDYTRLMVRLAVEAVDLLYRDGVKYSKAEVLLLCLCQKGEYTEDLFSISQPAATEKLMGLMDAINSRWGRGHYAPSQCTQQPRLGHASGDDESELHYPLGPVVDGEC